MKIKKAVILAGGNGTRLRPLTKIINKALLPIGNEPMIYHPIKKLVEAGIDEILIVTGGENPDGFLTLCRDGSHLGVKNLSYKYQSGANGIADALKLAKWFVGDDNFAVLLGDNIFTDSLIGHVESYTEKEGAKVLLTKVKDPRRFGCPEFADDGKITKIIEKPQDPPSPYAVVGIYFYPASIFTEVIPNLKPSARGEYEITDVNNWYLERGLLQHSVLDGGWSDAGTWPSWNEANALIAKTKT